MLFHVYDILEIEPLEYNEEIINFISSNNNNSQHSNQNDIQFDDLSHPEMSS
ncbi:5037_t:CDS:1, partial [Racocetra persica]